MATIKNMLKGIIYLMLMTLGSFSCCILLLPTVLLLPIHSRRVIKLRRSCISKINGFYLNFASSLIMHFCGTKIYLYSDSFDKILNDSNAIILSNHRTRVDWMFVGWCYCAYLSLNDNLRVILKQSLRSVPVYGWAMQLQMYIFLSRNRLDDLPHITNVLTYLIGSSRSNSTICDSNDSVNQKKKKGLLLSASRPSILIFPEGTDLSDSMRNRSNNFAKEKGLPTRDYVMYPKPTGLLTCLKSLANSNTPVHDLTIAYKDYHQGKRTSDYSILKGEFPLEVHICIKRIDSDVIKLDRPSVEQWLYKEFEFKETILQDFYEKQSLSLWPKRIHIEADKKKSLMIVLTWIISLLLFLYISSLFRWVCTISIILYGVLTSCGGLDSIELMLHYDLMTDILMR